MRTVVYYQVRPENNGCILVWTSKDNKRIYQREIFECELLSPYFVEKHNFQRFCDKVRVSKNSIYRLGDCLYSYELNSI